MGWVLIDFGGGLYDGRVLALTRRLYAGIKEGCTVSHVAGNQVQLHERLARSK